MSWLAGVVETDGTPTEGVIVRAFPSRKWGKPVSTVSDADGKWKIQGLTHEMHDVVYMHPNDIWEGKVSSRRMSEYDPADDRFWTETVFYNDWNGDLGAPTDDYTTVPYQMIIQGSTNPPEVVEGIGKFGNRCLRFGGPAFANSGSLLMDRYVLQRPHLNAYALITDFTFEAWIRPEKLYSGYQYIFTQSHYENIGVSASESGLIMSLDRKMSYRFLNTSGSSQTVATHPTVLNLGEWYHVVIQREADVMAIWVNGVRGPKWIVAGVNPYSGFNLSGSRTGSDPFFGYMNDTRYTRAARYDMDDEIIDVPTAYHFKGYKRNPITPNLQRWRFNGYADSSSTSGSPNILETPGVEFEAYANSNAYDFMTEGSFAADQYAEIDTHFSQNSRIFIRAKTISPTSANWMQNVQGGYMLTIDDSAAPENAGKIRIWRVNGSSGSGGSWTALTPAVDSGMIRGENCKIRFEAVGNTIKAFVNGVEKLMVMDSTHPTGRCGISCSAASSGQARIKFSRFDYNPL